MILAMISNTERVALVTFASQLVKLGDSTRPGPMTTSSTMADDLIWRAMNGYQDRDGILFELTAPQRSMVVTMSHSRMSYIATKPNGWLEPEYVTLESLVYNLTVGAAD